MNGNALDLSAAKRFHRELRLAVAAHHDEPAPAGGIVHCGENDSVCHISIMREYLDKLGPEEQM